ncbi:MAG: response regulator [Tannerellaceae bacterium]|jgi:signal transduction histidine kinase/ligand-binding sensor domain-containing protein/DNA-binding response OmpR family regulator|nr:response regulator [Tannerellaceae bacterium]
MKKTLLIIFIFQLTALNIRLFAYPDMQSTTTYLFTTEHGLSSTKITCIQQDNRNFLWIGTEDGLNKFDGYDFTVYKSQPGDSVSLVSNHITALFQDSNNRLWVATIAGLEYYDLACDGFLSASLNQPDEVIKHNQCTKIIEDKQGNLWFAVSGYGVLCYSPDTGKSNLLTPTNQTSHSLCSSYIRSMAEDKDGNLWFASQDNGLSVYNPETQTFRNYNMQNSRLPSNAIFDLCLLSNGNMLVSTLRGGLAIYDSRKDQFMAYLDVFNKPNTRSIFCAIEDHEGNILVGTEGDGVFIFDPVKRELEQHPVFRELSESIGNSKVHNIHKGNYSYLWMSLSYKGVFVVGHEDSGFKSIKKKNHDSNSLSHAAVTAVTTDEERTIWVATDGGGLNHYNPETKRFTHYTYDPNDRSTISDNAVVSVFRDSKNRIWAGTYTGGLCLFNKESRTFTRYRAGTDANSLQSDYIKSIQEDKRGFLWLGTNGGGLTRFDPDKNTFRTFRSAENRGLVNDYIIILFIDSKNRLWIGTYFGLSCMDIDTESFTFFDQKNGLSSLSIFSVAEDGDGTIWVGTANGLNRYNPEENMFTKVYPKLQEYYSPVVNGIIADDNKKQLWLSTNHGVVRYDTQTGELKRYFVNSGLQSNEFLLASYYKSPEGDMFFGGIDGLNIFKPNEIFDGIIIPKVYITNLKISNEPVSINKKINGRVVLTKNIEVAKKIKLKQNEKNFTLEFVAMGIFDPYLTVYSCKLEGFDKDWIKYDYTHRSVTYTNLNPGTYTLRIKASSNPDIWTDEETSLIIEIEPAIWNTWWAKLIYAILVLLLIYTVIRFIISRIKVKDALRIERFKLKQQGELNRIKTDFFTNISHEFRTPLTLIIGPLKRLINEEKDKERKKIMQIISRNAERLQRLINQILDLNKIEDGKITLRVQQIELVSFVADIISLYTEMARQKQITLSYTWDAEPVNVWYDADMLDKSLINLLHNAYKFTPENGKIHVNLKLMKDGKVILSINDTGIGMDENTKKHVFDRFYQGRSEYYNTGTGIGMHLTKTVVELHKGTITLESEPGKGSVFYITILPGKSHFSADEIMTDDDLAQHVIENRNENSWINEPVESVVELSPDSVSIKDKRTDPNRPLVLVIEDDNDMRFFIRQELENQYQIEEAANGKTGLEMARKLMPDLIITDVMMPEINGIELCRILKTESDTSHIPIIILTAQGSMEHRIEGLETGADSYISKPFHTKYLQIRVEKLIELRAKMKERFSKSINMDAQEITLTSTDERLLQNAIDYVRTNIENPELSVEAMSKNLGLSRTHLHRKLKALTGQSPVEFIKMIRMKQAAYLLSTGKLSVSEVGYKVGYNTPSYFSSSFNAYFGMSPTAYMEEKTNENTNGAEEKNEPEQQD